MLSQAALHKCYKVFWGLPPLLWGALHVSNILREFIILAAGKGIPLEERLFFLGVG